MRLVLIHPPDDLDVMLGDGRVFLQPSEPLGLLSLAAVARAAGHEVQVVDAFAERLGPDEVVARVVRAAPDVVGVGVLTCQGRVVYHLGRRIRQLLPDAVVVLGNVHAAVFAREYVAQGCADVVVHGEGEPVIGAILAEARDGRRWQRIPGVTYRARDGRVERTPGTNIASDLAALPRPARDLAPLHLYGVRNISNRNFVPSEGRRMLSLHTSRGCPYGCTFCVVAADRRARYLPAERVVADLEELERDYGAAYVFLQDPLFAGQRRRVEEIAAGIRRRGLTVRWGCTTHVNTVRPELVRLLDGANCHEISLGFETGVQRHLDAIGKRTTLARARAAAEAIRRHSGIRLEGLFMLGLPDETRAEALQTILFALRLPLHMAQFSLFTPYPGSAVFDELAARGELDTGRRGEDGLDPEVWLRYSAYACFGTVKPIWVTPAFTPEALLRTQRFAHRAFYLRPRPLLDQLLRLRPSNLADTLRAARRVLLP